MTSEKFDYLILGSGIAGLFAALKAARKGSVALVTKKEIFDCNSVYAQGGISC
ncbi:MAG: FAD-binding protein, partial [Lentisphaeraceae bacterium]|nr:FAD-binding protein [Lentisphaeraceae bacterium]